MNDVNETNEAQEIAAKYPNATLITVNGDVWALRPPTYGEWHAFLQETDDANAEKNARALEDLSRACLLHPPREAFNALLQAKPALGSQLGQVCADLAKADVEVRVKKR